MDLAWIALALAPFAALAALVRVCERLQARR